MHKVTLIPGDGIGLEVAEAARQVVDACGAAIQWELAEAGEKAIAKYGIPLPEETLLSIKENKVALKGPVTTPVGRGFRSVNVALRQHFNLYANIRPVKNFRGIHSRYKSVDLVIFRENTEDLYTGIEHKVGKDAAEGIKIITREASQRIVREAFEYAAKNQRKKVTAVHKANIMKLTDGLFLEAARDISDEYPYIAFEEMIVDAMAMNLVLKPEKYDVLVMPNLYGDILSDLCAGLVGGLGLVPGANIGEEAAIFEAVHGSAPDIAGKGLANPTALILSAVMMLKFLGEDKRAGLIEKALAEVFEEGKFLTRDLGGNASTEAFTQRVCEKILKEKELEE